MSELDTIKIFIQIFSVVIAVAGTVAGIGWRFLTLVDKKLEEINHMHEESIARIYRRMDERDTGYYEKFVLKETNALAMQNIKEMMDHKMSSAVQLISQKIDGMCGSLAEMKRKNDGKDKSA